MIPIRKLRSVLQYCVILIIISLVVYTLNKFNVEPVHQKLDSFKESLKNNEDWSKFSKQESTEVQVPKVVNKNVGIENIQADEQDIDPNSLIDWHDYTKIEEDKQRVGPGEQGKAVVISEVDENAHSDLFRANGFSGYASDRISVNRSVPDIRHPGCTKKLYRAVLPTVSVVIPFYNEHFSTLVRTFHSVLNRSPEKLIKEIILVDDASTKLFLGQDLDDYISKYKKVKIVRNKERSGLITARLAGAKISTAEVIIFLDSHTEANVNWLPPLLDPIAQDYRTAVCPFIDVIDFNNFQYRAQDEGARGAFDWQLYYKRLPLLPDDLKHPTRPFKSPVMAGGLFAISSKFFWELGGYDPGLEIWGGEQYELSFKIWQCGGTLVDAPCSRVGHIYRKYTPFSGAGKGDYLGRNYKRVAEVWMDEYKEYLYKNRPHYKNMDPGDISEQKALRDRLKCKPFSWFMKEVLFDLYDHYPPVEPPDFISGEFRSAAFPTYCVDSKFKGVNERVGMDLCNKDSPGAGGEQRFSLTWRKDIRPSGRKKQCWDVARHEAHSPVLFYNCHGQGGNQRWSYNQEKRWIVHGENPRCLDSNPELKELFVSKCDESSETQKWIVENINLDQLKNWDNPVRDIH